MNMRFVSIAISVFLPVLFTACTAEEESAVASSAASQVAASAAELTPLELTDAQWRDRLTGEQYYVLRQAGTERPFSSPFLKEKRDGVFVCAGCDLPLFENRTKFNSGSGWPSFWQPIAPGHVVDKRDVSLGMIRDENVCGRCGGHLGHVFEDGPRPTGLRYCINGDALKFVPAEN